MGFFRISVNGLASDFLEGSAGRANEREREKNKQQIREMEQARSISEAECYPFISSPQL